jgi:hypothetical protein
MKIIRWTFLGLVIELSFLASVLMAQTIQEVRIGWDAYIAPAPQVGPSTARAADIFTLLARRSLAGLLPRQRNPQISVDQIVILAANLEGTEIDGQLIPDPRILRAEQPAPNGELRGEVLHHVNTELLITIPDDSTIAELRLYKPRWTGTTFVLDWLGAIPLR